MVEGNVGLSRDKLIEFLDFAGEKGLLKKTTAESRKKAVRIVLGILDDSEAADLSRVDLEDVIHRHRNLATGKIMPNTLIAYESRTRTAIKDFIAYVNNPSSWKPGQQRVRGAVKAAPSATKSKSVKSEEIAKREGTPRQPSVHIDLQIHISPESTPEQIDQIFESISRHFPLK